MSTANRLVFSLHFLERFDGTAIGLGNISRSLLAERVADHHGGATANDIARLLIDGLLLKGKALLTEIADARLDNDFVAVEDWGEKVGVDIGHDGNDFSMVVVDVEHVLDVLLLAEVVVGKIGVVVDVTKTIHVVEANLYGDAVVEERLHGLDGTQVALGFLICSHCVMGKLGC